MANIETSPEGQSEQGSFEERLNQATSSQEVLRILYPTIQELTFEQRKPFLWEATRYINDVLNDQNSSIQLANLTLNNDYLAESLRRKGLQEPNLIEKRSTPVLEKKTTAIEESDDDYDPTVDLQILEEGEEQAKLGKSFAIYNAESIYYSGIPLTLDKFLRNNFGIVDMNTLSAFLQLSTHGYFKGEINPKLELALQILHKDIIWKKAHPHTETIDLDDFFDRLGLNRNGCRCALSRLNYHYFHIEDFENDLINKSIYGIGKISKEKLLQKIREYKNGYLETKRNNQE